MPAAIDMGGSVFGKLTVLRLGAHSGKNRRWICRCECGKQSLVFASNLRRGLSKSCGCEEYVLGSDWAKARQRKHGLAGTELYTIWKNMLRRCHDPRDKAYANYGGRGIKVCERWRDVTCFVADMAPRPQGLTLDRRNNDGHYSPDNCRWATRKIQQQNRRAR